MWSSYDHPLTLLLQWHFLGQIRCRSGPRVNILPTSHCQQKWADQISDWPLPQTGHMKLFFVCHVLPPLQSSQPGRKEEIGGRGTGSVLEEPEQEEKEEKRRELERDPSLKGSVLASQPFHHFNALSCGDVSLCMELPRPLFPVSSMFLASS